MQFTKKDLEEASLRAEKKASEALSKMARQPVTVSTKDSKTVSENEVIKALSAIEEHSIVAYTQALSGVSGLSLLSLRREEALKLTDLFNGRPEGATLVMKEIDRSTIEETLNILANAYVTELANETKVMIRLDVPGLVTRDRINEINTKITESGLGQILLFETILEIDNAHVQVQLYFFFMIES